MDSAISQIALDLYGEFRNIYPVTWKNKWDYYTEIALDRIADFTISRAANYQPFIYALSQGTNITTPVPADGYMNEDSAAIQASALGLTKLITYDDSDYVQKAGEFFNNSSEIKAVARKQEFIRNKSGS